MKSQLAAVIIGVLAIVCLVGCGQPGAGISATATPSGPTASPDPDSAPPYAEMRDILSRLWKEDMQTPDLESRTKVTGYLAALRGKQVRDWHAWVYQTWKDENKDIYRILPLYYDPFAEHLPTPTEWDYYLDSGFALDGLSASQSRDFKVGQEIKFDGVIAGSWNYKSIEVSKIVPVLEEMPTPMLPEDLKSVVITLERTECYGTCPVYTLEIQGDGKVIYNGRRFVETQGVKEANIGPDKVAELIAFFEKVNFFSLNDEYIAEDATDRPSAVTSISIGGKSKRVSHYQGDGSAPVKLRLLEDKIDEIANTEQWTK